MSGTTGNNGKRWSVTARYYELGMVSSVVTKFEVDELEEIQDIIESGPDWNMLKSITIRYNFADPSTVNDGEFIEELRDFQTRMRNQ